MSDTDPQDQAEPVRPGEELDLGRLTAYLRSVLPSAAADPVVTQFRHGHSNLTYLVTLGDTELVLRRPPFGNTVKSAHDMGREFRVLSALAPVFAAAPRPVHHCDDVAVIGTPFYLMERRHGVVLRRDFPAGMAVTPELTDRVCGLMVDTLAALHRLDYHAIGLDGFGKPVGYAERQVRGWTERYRAAETDAVPDIDAVARWLAERIPLERGAVVIHNDYKFDNVMFDPALQRVVAIFDWEMATIGDPLMELGTTLSYWIEPGERSPFEGLSTGPTNAVGMWSRRRFAERYAERTGFDISGLGFYYVYGLFRLAVVLQQIYARYARGFTKDARFAQMNQMVAALASAAGRAAGRDDV